MLSNKLTFSLVFVVMLVFTFSFLTTPAIAQIVSPPFPDNVTTALGGQNRFAVYAKTDSSNTVGNGIVGINLMHTTGGPNSFPDIAALLQGGGSIEFAIPITTNGTVTEDSYFAELKHRLVITEVMWGLNASDNPASESQWIEVYNPGGNLTANDDPVFIFSYTKRDNVGKKVTVSGTDYLVVDQVSTFGRFGNLWAPPGSSGNSAALTTTTPVTPPTTLVSMQRKGLVVHSIDDNRFKTKDDRIEGIKDGHLPDSWEASGGRKNMAGYFTGTPGSVPTAAGGVAKVFTKTPASLPLKDVIINEVRNDTSSGNLDWIELFNNAAPGTKPVDVGGWTLSLVTDPRAADKKPADPASNDVMLTIPKHYMAPGDYFVIYNRDPHETKLAPGIDVDAVNRQTALTQKEKRVNSGAAHWYVTRDGLKLPSTGKFLIVLREGDYDKDKPEKGVVDFTGNGFFTVTNDDTDTDVWPFIAWTAPSGDNLESGFTDNTFASTSSSWGRIAELTKDGVYRAKSGGERVHKDHWESFGRMGGIGYDRGLDPETTPGTPGYPNVSPNLYIDDQEDKAKTPYQFDGEVTISEIMFDAGPRWNLVQWIELYNSSMTQAINLEGWELEIRNKGNDVESFVDSSFEFDSVEIPPNQTLLLVSGPANTTVPQNRIYNLFEKHWHDLGLRGRDTQLLSPIGFYLKLTAKTKRDLDGRQKLDYVMDEAGNVDASKGSVRTDLWETDGGMFAITDRRSIVRIYGGIYKQKGFEKGKGPHPANDGQMKTSWRVSDVDGFGLGYYGHRDDIGTPGYRQGGPLPVSLSSFRPVRDKATGEVVIRWATESELNNAGFNILRNETRTGEFTVVNLKGIIPGHGTTSEKHVYEWTDTTAKPNVVYYYQIEDVSLDGNRTPLATTHLRGNVNAAGKVTTTWGDLKLQK